LEFCEELKKVVKGLGFIGNCKQDDFVPAIRGVEVEASLQPGLEVFVKVGFGFGVRLAEFGTGEAIAQDEHLQIGGVAGT
jgi:hypothetical protein